MNQLAQPGSERWITWMADLGLAYIGGIVVGAPVGLLCRAATGLDAALTTTMIVTMAAVLVCCRRRRRHPLRRGFEHWLQSDAGREMASMTRVRTSPRPGTNAKPEPARLADHVARTDRRVGTAWIVAGVFVLLYSGEARAQCCRVEGTVRWADNMPAIGVTVAVPELKLRTTTDERGTYHLDDVKPGIRIAVEAGIGARVLGRGYGLITRSIEQVDVLMTGTAANPNAPPEPPRVVRMPIAPGPQTVAPSAPAAPDNPPT